MKRLTITMLENITDGDTEQRRRQADELVDRLVLFVKPKVFTGHDGVEVRHDKEFESMCLAITKETGRDAKQMSVLEYYNAYEYLTKLSREAHKRQNKGR